MFLAGAGLLWLWHAPRDVSYWRHAVSDALLPADSPMVVAIGQVHLQWDSWQRPAAIHLQQVVLRQQQDQQTLLTVPAMTVTLNIWDALAGNLVIDDVTADEIALVVQRTTEGQWALQTQQGQVLELQDWLSGEAMSASSTIRLPFRRLELRDLGISFYDAIADETVSIRQGVAEWTEQADGNGHQFAFQLPAQIEKEQMALRGRLLLDRSMESGKALIAFEGANPVWLCGRWIVCDELPKLDMLLSGSVGLSVQALTIKEVLLSVKGGTGKADFLPHFPETLHFNSVELVAKLSDGWAAVELERLALQMGEISIGVNGNAANRGQGWSLALNATAENMPVNDLYKYWPATLAPQAREWATTSVRDGLATKASAEVSLKPEDFQQPYFPDEFLKASVEVEDVTVHYLPGFPKVTQANGVVAFTGITMTAQMKSAKMLKSTTIKPATFRFTDLNHPHIPAEVEFEFASTAADMWQLIQPPRFHFLAGAPIQATHPKGKVGGKVALAFDAFRGKPQGSGGAVNWDGVVYDVDVSGEKLSGLTLKEQFSLAAQTASFQADSKQMAFGLDGKVNHWPIEVRYEDKPAKAPFYHVKASVDKAALQALGVGSDVPMDGVIGVEGDLTFHPQGYGIDATVDFAQSSVWIDALGYRKPTGESAALKVQSRYDASGVLTDEMQLSYENSPRLRLQGKGRFDRRAEKLYALDVERLVYGRNDFGLKYRVLEDGHRVDLRGEQLDLAPWLAGESEGARTISGFPPLRLNIDLQQLHMPEGQRLEQVQGHVHCHSTRCESADLQANMAGKGQMKLTIFRDESGQRFFRMQSDDAGNLFRTFDVVDQMYGGQFDISGQYDDTKNGHPLSGRMRIEQFTLKDTPILGRILNMSSLTGMVETLTGQGMSFDKLASDFVFVDDRADLKNAKAVGSSLGILMEGSVNVNSGVMDLKGSLAPAYVLNSIVGKIPVIGELLVGGEGEGVFAVNYAVRGTYDDPKITVNPLSALTPGFTRKFFDLFDAPKEQSD